MKLPSDLQISTIRMDHLGLVAQTIKDMGLIEFIDQMIPLPKAHVSVGQRVAAMVLNGLGFLGHPLYLTPEFFKNTPTKKLLGDNVTADKLNDDCLGRCLDAIYEYGVSKFFSSLALKIGTKVNLLGKDYRLDSTSFSVTGAYKKPDVVDTKLKIEDEDLEKYDDLLPGDIPKEDLVRTYLKFGFSKDHRPDLKQIMAALVTTGPADFPVFLIPQPGNTSDKSEFKKIIESRVDELREHFIIPQEDMIWIADSALYCLEWLTVQKDLGVSWITRVPETHKELKVLLADLMSQELGSFSGQEGDAYRYYETQSDYGGVPQRYIVVYSEAAQKREQASLERRVAKEQRTVQQAFKKLSAQEFSCEEDALKALNAFKKTLKNNQIDNSQLKTIAHHIGKGRPKNGAEPQAIHYAITGQVVINTHAVEKKRKELGIFVLATNEMDAQKLPAADVLTRYKSLNGTERGFQFCKDPTFLMNRLFLKSEERIAALLSIMMLSLMVYNVFQWTLRTRCAERGETLPNQVGKPLKHITGRLAMEKFFGVNIAIVWHNGKKLTEQLEMLSALQKKILLILGPPYEDMYAI
jgi:transposase